MYTHCRQFPQFKNANDSEIRSVVAAALTQRPHLRQLMRFRNSLVLIALVVLVYVLNDGTTAGLGRALMFSGGLATVFLLLWNLVWVNFVLFRITSGHADAESG
jgi:hypothetical protein